MKKSHSAPVSFSNLHKEERSLLELSALLRFAVYVVQTHSREEGEWQEDSGRFYGTFLHIQWQASSQPSPEQMTQPILAPHSESLSLRKKTHRCLKLFKLGWLSSMTKWHGNNPSLNKHFLLEMPLLICFYAASIFPGSVVECGPLVPAGAYLKQKVNPSPIISQYLWFQTSVQMAYTLSAFTNALVHF